MPKQRPRPDWLAAPAPIPVARSAGAQENTRLRRLPRPVPARSGL